MKLVDLFGFWLIRYFKYTITLNPRVVVAIRAFLENGPNSLYRCICFLFVNVKQAEGLKVK